MKTTLTYLGHEATEHHMNISTVKQLAITLGLPIPYLALWHISAAFEYAPFASLWYAPAGLTVAILLLWKGSGLIRAVICAFVVALYAHYEYNEQVEFTSALIVAIAAAITHTGPYWLALKLSERISTLVSAYESPPPIRALSFTFSMLLGALGAALLGITVQVNLGYLPISVGLDIWLSWWIGDYVGAMIIGPVFFIVGLKLFGTSAAPGKLWLVDWLKDTQKNTFLKPDVLTLFAITLVPATIALLRGKYEPSLPLLFGFILTLLPLLILATRQTMSTLVIANFTGSLLLIFAVKVVGLVGDAVAYQSAIQANAIAGMVIIEFVKNIDERTQMLINSNKALTKAGALLSIEKIGSTITHELSTPLQSALFSIQSAAHAYSHGSTNTGGINKNLNTAELAINHAAQVVGKMRSFSTIPDHEPPTSNLKNVIEETLGILKADKSTGKIKFEILGDSPDFSVAMNESNLRQVLLNLTTNSVRSTIERNASKITISVNATDGQWISVVVQDYGPPLEVSDPDDLFSLDPNRESKGLGLGLWISKSIADQSGGALRYVETHHGRPCTGTDTPNGFYFELRVLKSDEGLPDYFESKLAI